MAKADSGTDPDELATAIPIVARRGGAAHARAVFPARDQIVSMINGEPQTWLGPPETVCPLLYIFVCKFRERLSLEESQCLWPFAARLINSQTVNPTVFAEETRRSRRLVDWTVRKVVRQILAAESDHSSLAQLDSLDPIRDLATLKVAADLCGVLVRDRAALPRSAAQDSLRWAAESARAASAGASGGQASASYAGESLASAIEYARADSANPAQTALLEIGVSILDELCPGPSEVGSGPLYS